MAYTSVNVEGRLLPFDLLDRIASGDADGQRPDDFGVATGRLSEEMQAAFSDIRAYWDTFQRRLVHSRESTTTLTREAWIRPVLERLGFVDLPFQHSLEAGGESYAISHRAGRSLEAPPVHIASVDQSLDEREQGSRRSPHALVQEYLNRSDALWGLVTNGERIRLLRDSARLSRPTYIEFDLRGMVESNLYNEFVLLYRLLHRSRWPVGWADAPECRLERYYQQGIDEGGRVRDRLREGVEAALRELGSAFLTHSASGELRRRVESGRLDALSYYRQLLRLIYRLLFLMVAEERRLLFAPESPDASRQPLYTSHYSIARLRTRCERHFAEDRYGDLWQGLLKTFTLFRDGVGAPLGLSPLNGELFGPDACKDLERARLENRSLLRAVYQLSTFDDRRVRRRVNYAALDVEELGSVYESLLDFHPQLTLIEGELPRFELVAGSERKQTGSYYTPPALVHELIESALVPVIDERLRGARTREDKQAALLGLRVCDPASGSGHFLLAAARRIGRELARVRSGELEPTPSAYRDAVREVIRHCIYAVDKNPLAVDLCKVALWIEGYNAGLPLTFLDHHIKCGDSLVGVFDLHVLEDGIPDDAFNPVAGDEKAASTYYKQRNKKERRGQHSLDVHLMLAGPTGRDGLAADFQALTKLVERTSADVHGMERRYANLRSEGGTWWTLKVACELWTSAFFLRKCMPERERDSVPTTDSVRTAVLDPRAQYGPLIDDAVKASEAHPFFHWPLEFPDVLVAGGGFDVVLGNPPWDRIKLQEQEFFASRDVEIARAPNKARRQKLIDMLPERNPRLAREFAEAKQAADARSKFVRTSGRFPLTAVGDVNLYPLFARTIVVC